MSKKILSAIVGLTLVAAIFVGVGVQTASANANCDMVTLLSNAGLIPADKLASAKAAAGCDVAMTSGYTFTRSLDQGSTGADVTALQNVLIGNGFSIPAGATGYYGPQTAAAVSAYQVAKGIANPGVGVVGPKTLLSLNANSAITPGTPVVCPAGVTCTPVAAACPAGYVCTPTGGSSSDLSGTVGDLVSVDEFTANIEDVVAEDSSEKVLGVEYEASDDSDLAITSMKLTISKTSGSGSTRLDRYVDTVSIMQGSTEVASVNADDFTKSGTDYSKAITLDNAIIRAGDKSKFYVVVRTIGSIDSGSDLASDLTVTLTQTRYTDASGAILTDSTGSIAATFGFEDVTANDELKLQSSSSNPSAMNAQVDETDTSDDFLVFAFNLKADKDSSDLNILTIPVAVEITSASSTSFTSEELISDIWLEVNGTVYDDFDNTAITVATTSATSTTYTFNIDEGDFIIDSGSTETVKVYVQFGAQDDVTSYTVGTAVKLSVAGSGIDVENVDGDSVTSPTGSITGNSHTVQLEAVNFTLKSVTTTNSAETASIDPYVTITMPLEIDSDETLYVLKDSGATDVNYTKTGGATTTVQFASGSGTPTVVSSGGSDYYEISGAKTVYVKFIVNGSESGTVGNVNITLDSIDAATTAGGSTVNYPLSPASSFDADATLRY